MSDYYRYARENDRKDYVEAAIDGWLRDTNRLKARDVSYPVNQAAGSFDPRAMQLSATHLISREEELARVSRANPKYFTAVDQSVRAKVRMYDGKPHMESYELRQSRRAHEELSGVMGKGWSVNQFESRERGRLEVIQRDEIPSSRDRYESVRVESNYRRQDPLSSYDNRYSSSSGTPRFDNPMTRDLRPDNGATIRTLRDPRAREVATAASIQSVPMYSSHRSRPHSPQKPITPPRRRTPSPSPPVSRKRLAESEEEISNKRLGTLPVKMRGALFGDLKPIPTNATIDPPPYSCFNCWQSDHSRFTCKRPSVAIYCYNCGRRGVTMANCPRCGEVHREFMKNKLQQDLLPDTTQEETSRGSISNVVALRVETNASISSWVNDKSQKKRFECERETSSPIRITSTQRRRLRRKKSSRAISPILWQGPSKIGTEEVSDTEEIQIECRKSRWDRSESPKMQPPTKSQNSTPVVPSMKPFVDPAMTVSLLKRVAHLPMDTQDAVMKCLLKVGEIRSPIERVETMRVLEQTKTYSTETQDAILRTLLSAYYQKQNQAVQEQVEVFQPGKQEGKALCWK